MGCNDQDLQADLLEVTKLALQIDTANNDDETCNIVQENKFKSLLSDALFDISYKQLTEYDVLDSGMPLLITYMHEILIHTYWILYYTDSSSERIQSTLDLLLLSFENIELMKNSNNPRLLRLGKFHGDHKIRHSYHIALVLQQVFKNVSEDAFIPINQAHLVQRSLKLIKVMVSTSPENQLSESKYHYCLISCSQMNMPCMF